jgi:hypothetical protein
MTYRSIWHVWVKRAVVWIPHASLAKLIALSERPTVKVNRSQALKDAAP